MNIKVINIFILTMAQMTTCNAACRGEPTENHQQTLQGIITSSSSSCLYDASYMQEFPPVIIYVKR